MGHYFSEFANLKTPASRWTPPAEPQHPSRAQIAAQMERVVALITDRLASSAPDGTNYRDDLKTVKSILTVYGPLIDSDTHMVA